MSMISNKTNIFQSTKSYTLVADQNIESLIITNIAPENTEDSNEEGKYFWVTYGTFGNVVPKDVETAFAFQNAYVYIVGTINTKGSEDYAEVVDAYIYLSSSLQSNTQAELPHDIFYYLGRVYSNGTFSNAGSGCVSVNVSPSFSVSGGTLKRTFYYSLLR